MKFKNKLTERVYTVLFMAIVTIVFIAVTSGIYLFTRNKIITNKTLFIKKAVLFAANISVGDSADDIEETYAKSIKEVRDNDGNLKYMEVYAGGNGELTGYAVIVTGPGLWGEIEAVLGFDRDLKEMTGIDFIKQNETPGLGARISEKWFREQFRNRMGPFKLVPEGTAKGGNEIDAITGASITSNAVLDIVNNTIRNVREIIK